MFDFFKTQKDADEPAAEASSAPLVEILAPRKPGLFTRMRQGLKPHAQPK